MKHNRILIGVLMLCAMTTALAQSPPNANPPVIEIIVVDVGANVPAAVPKLIDIMKKAKAIATKAGTKGSARLWAANWAGPDSGRFIIAVENPSLGVMAADGPKMQTSPEWQKLIADFYAAGFKVVSQSLLMEVPY
jgi:hypothetical protein